MSAGQRISNADPAHPCRPSQSCQPHVPGKTVGILDLNYVFGDSAGHHHGRPVQRRREAVARAFPDNIKIHQRARPFTSFPKRPESQKAQPKDCDPQYAVQEEKQVHASPDVSPSSALENKRMLRRRLRGGGGCRREKDDLGFWLGTPKMCQEGQVHFRNRMGTWTAVAGAQGTS